MNKYRKALNHIISCDREDCGVSNLSDAYRNDISTLLELIRRYEDEELVEWHPYPEEEPPVPKAYLVTIDNGSEWVYVYEDGVFCEDPYYPDDESVIAWRELPKPYGRPV